MQSRHQVTPALLFHVFPISFIFPCLCLPALSPQLSPFPIAVQVINTEMQRCVSAQMHAVTSEVMCQHRGGLNLPEMLSVISAAGMGDSELSRESNTKLVQELIRAITPQGKQVSWTEPRKSPFQNHLSCFSL